MAQAKFNLDKSVHTEYLVRDGFSVDCGFVCTGKKIRDAALYAAHTLSKLPSSFYLSIDYKTTSAVVGAMFREALARETNAIVNPIEKGHPDIIPLSGKNATEKELRNYPEGLEIKTTIGNVNKGSNLRAGTSRISDISGITWQAHHREVRTLLGLIWDFYPVIDVKTPLITGAFFCNSLGVEDWGVISGTTGRNTKVCGMRASGLSKMGKGWVILLNNREYLGKYKKILRFSLD